LWKIRRTPDPGQYEIGVSEELAVKKKLRTPNSVFKSPIDDRDILTNREGNPGPQYRIQAQKGKGVGQFGRSERWKADEYVGVKYGSGPPPGAYELDLDIRKIDVGERTFPRSRRMQERTDSGLDPGKYETRKRSFVKPSFNVKYDPDLKNPPKFKN
jgi:hypothetical protein